jgi:hypothetical protein
MRLDVLTQGRFPFPVKNLSEEEKAEALKTAKDDTCYLCGALHTAPNTPACPRVMTFECNPDGRIIKGSFWPEGVSDEEITLDAEGGVVSVTVRRRREWSTDRVVFAADLAEDENSDEGDGGAGQP